MKLLSAAAVVFGSLGLFQAHASTSMKNRAQDHAFVTTNGGAVEAGIHLEPNTHLVVHYSNWAPTLGSWNQPAYATRMGLGVDQFWGNSFYTHLSMQQRMLRYDSLTTLRERYDHDNGKDVPNFEVLDQQSVTYLDHGLEFGVGNRWQWDYFVLSIQWLGAYVPITEAKIDDESFDGNDRDIISGEEELRRERFTGPSLTSRVMIGISI